MSASRILIVNLMGPLHQHLSALASAAHPENAQKVITPGMTPETKISKVVLSFECKLGHLHRWVLMNQRMDGERLLGDWAELPTIDREVEEDEGAADEADAAESE